MLQGVDRRVGRAFGPSAAKLVHEDDAVSPVRQVGQREEVSVMGPGPSVERENRSRERCRLKRPEVDPKTGYRNESVVFSNGHVSGNISRRKGCGIGDRRYRSIELILSSFHPNARTRTPTIHSARATAPT